MRSIMKRVFVLTGVMISYALPQEWQWTATYNNGIDIIGIWDRGYKVFETYDGGLLIFGHTDIVSMGGYYYFHLMIIKTDEFGNLITMRTPPSPPLFFGLFREGFVSFSPDTFLAYVAMPIDPNTYAPVYRPYLLGVNAQGEIIFEKDSFLAGFWWNALARTRDGNLIGLYGTASPDSFLLCKFTLDEEIIWEKWFQVFHLESCPIVRPVRVSQTLDGGFIIPGNSTTPVYLGGYGWVLKTDESGDSLWAVHPPGAMGINAVAEISENKFLCVGTAGWTTLYLCEINNGVVSWWQMFTFDSSETCYQTPYSIIKAFDRNFVFCGDVGSYIGSEGASDGFIMKVDSFGNILSKKRVDVFGRTDEFYHIIQTRDSGYVCTGTASRCTDPEGVMCESLEVCLVKFTKDGEKVWENTAKIPNDLAFSVSPSPFNSSCIITAPAGSYVEIYDVGGRLVWSSPFYEASGNPQRGDLSHRKIMWEPDESVKSGIYFVRAITKDGQSITKRAILIR